MRMAYPTSKQDSYANVYAFFLHLDGNSFYCSCERLFRPALRGKPVVVLSNNDGCIVALTKEAKAVGLKRGMPLFKVKDIVEANKVAVLSSN